MSNTTWLFEYDLPRLKLVLVCPIQAANEAEALAIFRKRRPHGRLRKINDRHVKDDGNVIVDREEK